MYLVITTYTPEVEHHLSHKPNSVLRSAVELFIDPTSNSSYVQDIKCSVKPEVAAITECKDLHWFN